MEVIIKGSANEIAALVQELQERQADCMSLSQTESGIKLCAEDILKHQ